MKPGLPIRQTAALFATVHLALEIPPWRLLTTFFLCMGCFVRPPGVLAQDDPQNPPSVTTDRADYAPGEIAVITGSGFQGGETVTLQVLHADGTPATGEDHEPWTVVAAADGTFSSSWHVCEDDCVGSTLFLTASGGSSGASAQTSFTDSAGAFAYSWGYDGLGQLGNNTTGQFPTPVQVTAVAGGQTAVIVAAGENHSLALANDGSAWAWGDRSFGQLGDGTSSASPRTTPVPITALPGDRRIVSLAGGRSHSLAAANDGTVWAWGSESSGQLGDGGSFVSTTTTPIQVSGILAGKNVVAVACGTFHSLALAADGTVFAWGNNPSGQLGNGTTGQSAAPIQVNALPGGRKAMAIAGGGNHSLAAANDGTVWAWGRNNFGQLGNNTLTDNLAPVQVQGLSAGTKAIAVGAGFEHSLALAENGTVWAWGRGDSGQLGNGAFVFSKVAVQVNALPAGRKSITIAGSNGGNHSLAAADDGTVWTWGSDSNGQLGNDATLANSATPVQAQGLLIGHKAVSVACGGRHSLAAVQDNSPPAAKCKNVTVSAGANCTANASIDDGSTDPDSGDTITVMQTPAGPYSLGQTTVTLTVTDSHGASSSCSATVTVADTLAPVPNAASLPAVVAQCSAVLPATPTATDACEGTITATTSAPTTFGQGDFTIVWTFTDSHSNSSTQNQQVHVHDTTAPVPNAASLPDLIAQCSAALPAAPTATDACDGQITATTSAPATFGQGDFTIAWTFSDSHGNSVIQNQQVHVHDTTAPDIACPANIPASCSANVDPGTATATDNCPGVTVMGLRDDGQPLSNPYPNGVTTITWTAADASGNSASCYQLVTVNNLGPTVAITSPASGAIFPVGTLVNFTGTFTDSLGGPHSVHWTFDAITQVGAVNESLGTVSTAYSFAAAGVYMVTLTVSNSCAGNTTATTVDGLTAMVVIYDPNGGFVTGGGWINSPSGAFLPQPTLTGKANFGFVSKYLKGATIPTGETEFLFKVANLNFHSTSYEWLVVSGTRAQYKGSGQINGAGNYGFLLTAMDGQVTGGGGTDKFRIKIWDKNNSNAIVYDNMIGAADGADPTTAIGGGSIVIHK